MHSVNLLVADRSPDSAEQINSILRNSGIKVRVIHAESSIEVKRVLDNDSPVLILYADADPGNAPLEEVNELATAFNVPLALFTAIEENENLAAQLSGTACFVINAQREDLLTAAVERLVRNAENERLYASRQQYLEELEHRYNLLLDSSRDAIAYIHEGLHVYANRAYLEALRLENADDTMALSLLELIKPADESTNMKAVLRDLSRGQLPESAIEVRVNRPDGSDFEAQLMFSPARFDGEDCTQMMMQRKDAASELASELERMRVIDPLTRMSNRHAFLQELERCIETDKHDSVAAVLYIVPDGIDALQHDLGTRQTDDLIADFAGMLRSCIDETDKPGRVSENGFAVLAHRPTVADMESLAQDILKTCRGHIVEIGERAFSISCSIGISNIGRMATDPGEIINHARSSQIEAAQTGDSFEVHRPQLTAVETLDGEQAWIDRIKHALGNQDLYTVQQTIVDLDGDGDQLVENIVFMRGEDGDHPASDFQLFAERNDLAGAIDRNVIPGLLKTFVDINERQVINLSSSSILDYGFPGWFASQMKATCVEGDKVILQIAASAAHTNLRPAQRLMNELKPIGCRLSVSQFDADRRTRQLLEHLDTAFIKLDPELTRDLLSNTKNQEAIRKIVEAAEQNGVEVIADEVADTSSLAVLWQCGVKLIAGAFLSESSQVLAQ